MRLACLAFALVAALSKQCRGYTQTSVPGDYMLCRKLPDIFGSVKDDSDSEKEVVGKPGPAGIDGPTGRKGLPGPRGEPDYDKVKDILKRKARSLNARLEKMEAELQYLKANPPKVTGGVYTGPTESPEDLLNGRRCMDKYLAPINLGSMCYAFHGSEGLSLTFDYAQSNCSENGGRLASPASKAVYQKIYDYADKSFQKDLRTWTGFKYENDKLLNSDGSNSTYVKWMSYYPKKGGSYSFYRSYSNVVMYIDTGSYTMGLQNVPASRRRYSYALCEYDLNGPFSTVASKTTTTTEEPDDYYYY